MENAQNLYPADKVKMFAVYGPLLYLQVSTRLNSGEMMIEANGRNMRFPVTVLLRAVKVRELDPAGRTTL